MSPSSARSLPHPPRYSAACPLRPCVHPNARPSSTSSTPVPPPTITMRFWPPPATTKMPGAKCSGACARQANWSPPLLAATPPPTIPVSPHLPTENPVKASVAPISPVSNLPAVPSSEDPSVKASEAPVSNDGQLDADYNPKRDPSVKASEAPVSNVPSPQDPSTNGCEAPVPSVSAIPQEDEAPVSPIPNVAA